MRNRWLMVLYMIGIIAALSLAAISLHAGEKKDAKQEATEIEDAANKPGGQLYFDPDKAKGVGVDDLHITSDPAYKNPGTYEEKRGAARGAGGVDDREVQHDTKTIEIQKGFEVVDD